MALIENTCNKFLKLRVPVDIPQYNTPIDVTKGKVQSMVRKTAHHARSVPSPQ